MMYEKETYEAIMERVLARVGDDVDKREGSMIWNAAGPAAAEMAILYTALDFILDATFADTAPREYLIRRAAERGIAPKAAEKAVYRGEFNRTVPIGSRFSRDALNYLVTQRMEEWDRPEAVAYRVECETAGDAGNSGQGELVPIEYIDGLTGARLAELIIAGADEEGTEAFRARYIEGLKSRSFGGNQADYREKALELAGVGAVKVFPVWDGGVSPQSLVPPAEAEEWCDSVLPELSPPLRAWLEAVYGAARAGVLTVGGRVELVIADSALGVPSAELIADVQAAVDPERGEGLGTAPIGHSVTVKGVSGSKIDVDLELQYKAEWHWEAAKSYVECAIDDYFGELAQGWQESDGIVVRVSQIEARVLTCPGIADVGGTLLNGAADNVTLDGVSIPVRGAVRG